MFKIRMGLPDMEAYWKELIRKKEQDSLDTDEEELFKKLVKSLKFLSQDPRYPGLQTHEIEPLSRKYGMKIWQSYLDQGQKARRIFWAYGPNRREITILGIEPHPEDRKKDVYKRIRLSRLPGK